jgi:hypothetical protein
MIDRLRPHLLYHETVTIYRSMCQPTSQQWPTGKWLAAVTCFPLTYRELTMVVLLYFKLMDSSEQTTVVEQKRRTVWFQLYMLYTAKRALLTTG